MLIQNSKNHISGDVLFYYIYSSRFFFFIIFILLPHFAVMFEILLLTKNATFFNGMEVSMMKNDIVKVEYSANASYGCQISLV
jgi:hypothetical protein